MSDPATCQENANPLAKSVRYDHYYRARILVRAAPQVPCCPRVRSPQWATQNPPFQRETSSEKSSLRLIDEGQPAGVGHVGEQTRTHNLE